MKAQQDNQWSFNHNYIPISLINICELQGPLSLLFTILLVSQHNCDPVSNDDIRVSLCYVSFVSLPHTLLYRMISRTLPGTARCWPRSWPPCWTGSRAARARRIGEPSPWSRRSWVSSPIRFSIKFFWFFTIFLERALKTTEELSKETRRRNGKKYVSKKKTARRGKQGFDSDFIDVLLDSLNIDEKDDLEFEEDFKNSGRRTETPEETRGSSGGSKVEDLQRKAKSNANETCEEKEAKSQVQVCVPEYEVQPQRLFFAAQETYDEKYCYTKLVFSLRILWILTYIMYIGPIPNVNLSPSRSKDKCAPTNISRSSTMSPPQT